MTRLSDATWAEIDALRGRMKLLGESPTIQVAAQSFTKMMTSQFESLVLARLFVVVPLTQLSVVEQDVARSVAPGDPRLTPTTHVLSMLGTSGRIASWCDRTQSRGHLAIPLIDQQFVQGIPMIARLLGDLEIDLSQLADGRPIATRRMLGGTNATFYVPDAPNSKDTAGRHIIPDQKFVKENGIRTVFGMGGSWLDGTLVVSIFFSAEVLDRLAVDRFPSLISNFKMATARLKINGHLFA